MLSAGTEISATTPGFAYICKPDCSPPPDRLSRLKGLRQHVIGGEIPANSLPGHYVGAPFPDDFEKGMLNHCSSMDVCWTIIVGNQAPDLPPGNYSSLNTLEEASDSHAIRFTGNILCPFLRSEWNGIWVQAGSKSGDYQELSEKGFGAVIYQKLPLDW